MSPYPMFIGMATLTILSPGPGVLKSLTNAISYGRREAFIGILGLVCGVFCVACLSASSLGLVLASSATAFGLIKLGGALYLVYLGLRMLYAPAGQKLVKPLQATPAMPEALPGGLGTMLNRRFLEGLVLQFSNPKALIFFLAVLPQFIDRQQAYLPQFALLLATFCLLLALIHSMYVLAADRAAGWIRTTGSGLLDKLSAAAFLLFALLLLRS